MVGTFYGGAGVSTILHSFAQEGMHWSAPGVLFTPQRATAAHVHVWWDMNCDQPWCLAPNETTLSSLTDARRVWPEESFRDLKSGGWPWQNSYIQQPDRAVRLILILARAYGWMLTLGTRVTATLAKPNKYSVFRRGLRHFK